MIEEVAKALYIAWLLRSNRVGFMVDTAISGFAVGAGFAVLENLTYIPGSQRHRPGHQRHPRFGNGHDAWRHHRDLRHRLRQCERDA